MPFKFNAATGQLDLVIRPGGGVATTDFQTDSGTAVPTGAGVISIVGGAGVVTSGAGNTVTIDSSGGFTWSVVTGASQAMAVNNGYIGNRGTAITFTLPTTAAVGSAIQITNIGVGLPIVAQNAGESINFVASTTTVGVGGTLTAVEQFASIEIICVVADTQWNVLDSTGNWTIV